MLALFAQVGVLNTEPQAAWWAQYVPWLALVVIVGTAVLTAAFLPTVLRGGLSRFTVTKALADGTLRAADGADAGTAAAPSPDQPVETSDETAQVPGTAPTWGGLDLGMFHQVDADVD